MFKDLNLFSASNGYIENLKELFVIVKFANWAIEQFVFVEDIGVEPMTLCVQGRCSSQLS